MKTALTKIEEILEKNIKYINKEDDQSDRYYQAGMMFALNCVREKKETEKQQIIEAYNKGQQYYNSGYNPTVSEEYYKTTFNTTNK